MAITNKPVEPKTYPVKTKQIRVRHKNGTTYVEERQIQYDPKIAGYRVLSSHRIGKISPETGEIVRCRPKRKHEQMAAEKPVKDEATTTSENSASAPASGQQALTPPVASAARARTGAMDLIRWAGKKSGIEQAVRDAFSVGVADKLLSIAYFLLATGHTVNEIDTWQLEHDIPYEEGMSADICYDLFEQLGLDESGMQTLFTILARHSGESPVLAFDSTTTSGYSKHLEPFMRYGFNKASDGLQTYKLISFYSIFDRRTVAFDLQPGNIPDVISLTNAVKRGKAFGLKVPEFVIDNGFTKKANLCFLYRNHFKFTGRPNLSDQWVAKWIKDSAEAVEGTTVFQELARLSSMCPFDSTIHGTTRMDMVEFTWMRQRTRGGVNSGTEQSQKFRVYIHYYLSKARAQTQEARLTEEINLLRAQIESGIDPQTLSLHAQKMVERFFILSRAGRGGHLKVRFNDQAYAEALKTLGMFALVSNERKDPWEALKIYRMRNRIEQSYRVTKTELDGERARLWHIRNVRGKELCRMVALGYHFYLQVAVDRVRTRAVELSRDPNLPKEEQEKYKDLVAWLRKMTLRKILAWFDCVETVVTKNRFAQERWSTESVKRDQLFLAMLKDPKSSERLDVTEIPTCVGEDDLPDGFETGGDGGADAEPEDAAAVADEATVA